MKVRIIFLILAMVFFHMAVAQENDNCVNAILLEIGNECVIEEYSNATATAEADSVASDPACGTYAGGDVWFKAVVPASGALRIEVDNLQGATPPSFTLYSGHCGNFTEVICVRNDHKKTVYQPSLAEDTVYIRVYSYFSEKGGSFSLCAFEPQIPQNDLCENALLLEVGESCQLDTLSNAYATAQPDTVASEPSCGFYQGGDIWFKAVMPDSGLLRINKNRISGATHPSMTIYTGSCGDFTEVLCSKNDPIETLDNPSLAGQTLYFRLYSYSNEEGASFSFCLYEEEAPENDDCEDALSISVGDSCTFMNYSNKQATAQPSATAPEPSCGQYQGGDVWFKTVMPASGALRIETDEKLGPTLPSVTLYSGSCGDFEEVACMSNDEEQTFFHPQLAGKPLYIRVYAYNSDDGGPFSLCVFEPTLPSNDLCEHALTLPVGETCLLETYSNANATAQPADTIPEPSCGQYQGGDVWFKAIVPASGLLHIKTENLEGATKKSVTIYSGVCGNFTEVACGELTPDLLIDQAGLAEDTVYLRLYSYATEEGGEFGLCAYAPPVCIPDTVDAGQIALCKGESYPLGAQTITEPGDYTELFQNSQGCDSLVTLSVIVNEVNTTVVQDGETLTAQAVGVSYQWISCNDGNIPVAGETAQTFTAPSAGEYAVIITENSCTDTSACYRITVVGVTDEDHSKLILFPNPVGEVLHIELPRSYDDVWVELIDMRGQIIEIEHFQGKSMPTLDMSSMPSGGYIVRIHTKEGMAFMKMIKE